MKPIASRFLIKLLLNVAVFSLFSQAATAFPVSEEHYEQQETLKKTSPAKAFFIQEASANYSWLSEKENETFSFNYDLGKFSFEARNLPLSGRFYHYFQDKKLLLKSYIFPFHFFW